MKPAISIQNVSKLYHLGPRGPGYYRTFREAILQMAGAPWRRLRRLALWDMKRASENDGEADTELLWALKDVSFDIMPGQVVGVVGRNGAGKSTLLKILSRVTEATRGRVEIRGRIGSLLEVGTGFHPELTGRENIYLNGAILGMRRREIVRKFDEIVDFATIERFLDTPVKHYSSGMYVRLAFAVAAHLEPEILVVDEVLAVGDMSFQEKCLDKMRTISQHGRTVLFVSHNLPAVEGLCTHGVLMEQGRSTFVGSQSDTIARYTASLRAIARQTGEWMSLKKDRGQGSTMPVIAAARISSNGKFNDVGIPMGAPLVFEVACFSPYEMTKPCLAVGIKATGGQRVTTFHTSLSTDSLVDRVKGEFCFRCELPFQSLVPGDYLVMLRLESSGHTLEEIHDALTFTILPSDFFGNGTPPRLGVVAYQQKWSLTRGAEPRGR